MLRNYRDFGSSRLRPREQADEDTHRILPREGKTRMGKQNDESKMTTSYTSRIKTLAEDNYSNNEFRHVQPKKSPRTSVKLRSDGEFIRDKEVKRCTPSLVARLMGLEAFPPFVNKHHEQREMKSKSSTSIDSEECKDVFEVTEISKSKKQEYRPYRQSKVDLKSHDIDQAYAKRKLINETDVATGERYCDILENFDSTEDCYIKFLEEPRVFKKRASHTMFSDPSNELSYYTERYDGRPSRYLRGHVSSHRKYITNVVGRHKKEDHHSTPVVLLKPSFDKVQDMIKTVPSARFLNKDQYRLRKQEGFHVPKRCVLYAGEREMHNLYSNLEVTGHDSNRLRKIARQVTERLKNNGSIRDESSHECYKPFQWTNDDASISSSSYYSSESVISKEAKKRLSDRFKMIQQRSTGKSHSNLQDMLVSDRDRLRTNSNSSDDQRNVSYRMTSNSIPLSSSLVYLDIKHAKRKSSHNMVLDKRQNDFVDVNLTPRESTFHNLNLIPTQVHSSKEESEMSEREIHMDMDEMHLPPKVNDEASVLLDDGKPVQHAKVFSLQTTEVERSSADFCGSAMKKKIDGNPQINSQFHTQYEEKSPVSLLEPTSSDDDPSSSECFQKLSADIKELQMQLKLLKSKSLETDVDGSELAYSDEDIRENTVQEFNDGEDRDYSYLLDVLIYSGIHSTKANEITNPIRRELFEKLEKKYNEVEAWSISERMLLFDHIREIISDIVEKSKRCVMNWAREDLVEETWQVAVKQRKEQSGVLEAKLLLDPGWLNLEDDVYDVVVELERMLTDEAMEGFIGL